MDIKYIGKTKNINSRLKTHIWRSKWEKTYKSYWIQHLLVENLTPIIEILDIVEENNWGYWEEYWISQFKAWNFKLTNLTNGGENPPILTGHTEETKAKLSRIKKEFFKTRPHHLLGSKQTSEHIRKAQANKSKIIYTKEVRNNMSVAHLKDGARPCSQYSKDGLYFKDAVFIKKWDRVIDAAKYYNNIHILDVCKGSRPFASGFRWVFNED